MDAMDAMAYCRTSRTDAGKRKKNICAIKNAFSLANLRKNDNSCRRGLARNLNLAKLENVTLGCLKWA